MKKKILFILHIPPPVHGSAIVGKQIKESKLINSSFDTDYINLGTSKDIIEIGGWSFKKTFIYFKIIFDVLKKMITNKYDLVYIAPTVSGFGFYKDCIIIFIVKLFAKKTVFHLHNKGVSKRNKTSINEVLYRQAFKNVEVILLSKLLYFDISEFISENKIHICPNGIDLIPNLEIYIKDKCTNKVPRILFLSNLIESKGVIVLLRACKIIKEKGVRFKCVFVGGEGDISKNIFKIKVEQFGLTNDVFYLGKKYGNEKDSIFQESDIFVFPTFYHNECFPLVCLEAMQYSLPVISTNEGGISDIVEDKVTGYIIDRHDSDMLAKKIIELMENRQLIQQLGINGRKKFLGEFTLDKFERNLLKILEKIA